MAPQAAASGRTRNAPTPVAPEETTEATDTEDANVATGGDTDGLPVLPPITDELRNNPLYRESTRFLIERAQELEQERAQILKRIQNNRTQLRGKVESESANEQETEWIKVFYPEKERGNPRNQEEANATRKLREAVRKAK